MNLTVGDRVTYEGEEYFIVGGPINSMEGAKYKISKVPPEKLVLEHELKRA